MDVLINDVTIQVKIQNQLSDKIITNTGIVQGDCLSAVLFIYYLAACLTPQKQNQKTDHALAVHREGLPTVFSHHR